MNAADALGRWSKHQGVEALRVSSAYLLLGRMEESRSERVDGSPPRSVRPPGIIFSLAILRTSQGSSG